MTDTITYIKWLDASGTSDNIWQDLGTLPTSLVEIETAGIIAAEDEDSVTVVLSTSEIAFMGDVTIPKVGITFRKDFEVAE